MTEDAILMYTVNKSTQEEIEKHLFTCDKDFVTPLSERVNIKDYSEKIHKNSITFEAWSDKDLIGLIACYANDPNNNVAYITNVSVLSNYRKKGIAQTLFKELFKNKTILRFNKIEIKVFKNDISTINLYKKNGFKVNEQDDKQFIMEHVFFNQSPLVSISCITYNHLPYIRQCIDGFIKQQTAFPIEVLIHDDASTDGTTDIIREYETNYPEVIKPIYQKENQYSKGMPISATFNWPRAKGKYIAMCEGDDYWTDPLKLQKQVDFLEKNQEYVLTSHLRIIVDEKGNPVTNSDSLTKDYSTQCIVFRNVLRNDFLTFDSTGITNGDTFLFTYLESFGKMTILDFVGSAYRKTGTGIWASYDYRKKFELATRSFSRMEYFFKKYDYKISLQKTKIYYLNSVYNFALSLKSDKRKTEAYKYYFKFLQGIAENLNNRFIYNLGYLKMLLAFPFK